MFLKSSYDFFKKAQKAQSQASGDVDVIVLPNTVRQPHNKKLIVIIKTRIFENYVNRKEAEASAGPISMLH